MAQKAILDNKSLDEIDIGDGIVYYNDNQLYDKTIPINADTIGGLTLSNIKNDINDTINTKVEVFNSSLDNIHNNYPFFHAYYNGSGDTVCGGILVWNTVVKDSHNAYNKTTGKYIIPKRGLYMVCVNYYSNDPNNGSARPVICHARSDGTAYENECIQHLQQACASCTDIFQCEVGEQLYFSAQNPTFPINFYAAAQHNGISIAMINPM